MQLPTDLVTPALHERRDSMASVVQRYDHDAPRATWGMARYSFLLTLGVWIFGCTSATSKTETPKVDLGSALQENHTPGSDNAAHRAPVRLVVWLTVDQMRGDYLERYSRHFGEDGFSRLLKRGVWYKNAHYTHAITETAPGHATLFTGLSPKEHGIVGNSWLDQRGREVPSVQDEGARLVGPGVGKATAPEDGRSPRLLLKKTVGDVLVEATDGRAKVVSLSMKDRGAILPAGRKGRAVWMGSAGFVTSTFYGDVPHWIASYQEAFPASSYLTEGWHLVLPEEAYLNAPAVSSFADTKLGRGFPHLIPTTMAPEKALKNTPFGDDAVLDLARFAIESEGLGADEVKDLLALSLSSTDLVGHLYGVESRELEDQLVRLDRTLAEFFWYLDKKLGDDSYAVVLSADHGGAESVEFSAAHHADAVRLTESDVEKAAARAVERRYGTQKLLLGVSSPYVFLARDEVKKAGLDLAEVRRTVADEIAASKGVELAYPIGAALPEGAVGERIAQSIFLERSGDVYVIPKAHSLFLQSDEFAATHGSPWEYDSHVPIVLMVPGGREGILVEQFVDVRSLAPSVAALLGVGAPGGSEGLPPLP